MTNRTFIKFNDILNISTVNTLSQFSRHTSIQIQVRAMLWPVEVSFSDIDLDTHRYKYIYISVSPLLGIIQTYILSRSA